MVALLLQVYKISLIKNIVKDDVEVKSIATEACFTVSRAMVRRNIALMFIVRFRELSCSFSLCFSMVLPRVDAVDFLQELFIEDMVQKGTQSMLEEDRDTLDYKDIGKKELLNETGRLGTVKEVHSDYF